MNGLIYSGRDNLDVMKEAINYNKYLLDLIIASAKKGDSLVDYGAGSGTFSLPVASAGYRVICVETDPILSASLKSHGMVVLNDLAQAPDGSIDYIYSLNVLEHIVDDNGVVALWFRKLRPGGKLLVYVPAFQVLFSSMDRKVGHIRRYSKDELRQKLSRAGFEIAESRYADSIGFLAALMYKLLRKEDGAVDLKMLRLYDRWVFPVSKFFDVITNQIVGKNVYVRAIKPANPQSAKASNFVNTKPHISTLWRYSLDLRFVLLFAALAYIAVYFAIPATPGNSPGAHPLGWWGWFDQGKYLLSANAFAQFDFSPDKHFYPPLYPAIGAIFLKWSSGHLFFAPNLAALIWFAYVFIRFADLYIPRWGSIALLFATTIFNHTLFENYVIPWTSTLCVALLASGILGLVWLAEVRDGVRDRVSGLQVFFVATCLGLLVPTRPADAVVGCVIGLGLLIGYWRTRRESIECVPRTSHFLVLVMAGSIIGPLLFLGFNMFVFGSPLGGYIQVTGSNGFFPADLAEKFVSIWLDGFTLYGEPNAGLTERYPWLFVSLAGLIWVLIRGDGALRSVAVAIVLLFVLYLPYGDLLPNGLWRYLNIHYFKWTFPFLALFAVLLIKQAWFAWRQCTGRVLPLTLLFGIPILLSSLYLAVDVTPVLTRSANNRADISFDLPDKQVDLVDFRGLSGGFTDVYFGEHRLLLDGRELKRVRDYRLLPMNWGVRLLFIRPAVGRSVEFLPDQRLTRHAGPLSAQIGTYRFALGALKPFRQLD